MAIVKTIHDGETTIIICDDCLETKEENQKALKRIAKRVLPQLQAKMLKEEKEKNESTA